VRRTIVASMLSVCRDLAITPIGEGVETEGEARTLLDMGVTLQQGYLFARPGFEALPVPAPLPGPERRVA
jgi:EAL domain-containing protein (putative c-di-GMP-specific phosphodiesterase class I)